MTKRTVMITVEENVHIEAKRLKLNVSSVCEEALKARTRVSKQTILEKDCKHIWGLTFCVPWGLAKECGECGTMRKVFISTE